MNTMSTLNPRMDHASPQLPPGFSPRDPTLGTRPTRLLLGFSSRLRPPLPAEFASASPAKTTSASQASAADVGGAAVAIMGANSNQLKPVESVNPYMRKVDNRTRLQVVKDFIYNPAEGTILGHTKKRWGIVGLFYLVFYSVLAVLCAICMMGLLATIDDNKPTYTLESSIIGINPGLGFRPISDKLEEQSLIWFSSTNATQIRKWVTLLDKFFEQYLNKSKLMNSGRNQVICDYNKPPQKGKVCAVDITSWGPCTSELNYGYNNSSPCVFIKLNRIYNWIPNYYNNTDKLPEKMPLDLKDHINKLDKSMLNTVWVSCSGVNPHDNENIGELEYFPKIRGFPGYYYPYVNLPEYLSPIVAVQLKRPQRNKIITIRCQAWEKNILHKQENGEPTGSVDFQILIED